MTKKEMNTINTDRKEESGDNSNTIAQALGMTEDRYTEIIKAYKHATAEEIDTKTGKMEYMVKLVKPKTDNEFLAIGMVTGINEGRLIMMKEFAEFMAYSHPHDENPFRTKNEVKEKRYES